MLQSILFFVLGFLCSGFLALMVAPAVWRRAVVLTRKRIEASVPLSAAEIQADKDRMRAELAMTIRRLEMNVKSLRERSAAQAVEIARAREALKRLAGERDEHGLGRSQSEARAGELEAELGRLRQQLAELSGKLADAKRGLEVSSAELGRVGKLRDEAAFAASSRQIELVARQSEIVTLSGEVTDLVAGRQEAERRHEELIAESRRERSALQEEKRRADRLEQRSEQFAASLRQREEAFERRQQELLVEIRNAKAALQEEKGRAQAFEERSRQLAAVLEQREAELGRRAEQLAQLREKLNGAGSGEEADGVPPRQAGREAADAAGEAPQRLADTAGRNAGTGAPEQAAERDRLQDRLAAMAGPRHGADDGSAAARANSDDEARDALLREQMSDLAAEVIRLTAKLDGPDSPIQRALSAAADQGEPLGGAPDRITSLADRVRALQRAAPAG